MNQQELLEAAEYCENDAKYLFKQAAFYYNRNQFADHWLSDLVRTNAQHSLDLADNYRKKLN